MQVCEDCALCRALVRVKNAEIDTLIKMIVDLEEEIEATNKAFWELAGDVRLSPVHVHLVDDYVSVIFPAEEIQTERQVSA